MKHLLQLAAALLLLPAALFAADQSVARVDNGAAPAGGVETWNLQQRWQAGGDDDAVFFGTVQSAVFGADGNLYVLDDQLSEVHVYAPDGTYLRTIGREGDGPGEFRRAGSVITLPGGRIGVVAGFPGSIICLEANGNPAPSINPGEVTEGGFRVLFGAASSGERLYLCGARMGRTDKGMSETRYLSVNDLSGEERAVLMDKERIRDFSRPSFVEKDEYFVMDRWDVAPDGRVYAAADRDVYAVNVYSPDGVLERVFTRRYEPRLRTQEEKDRVGSDLVIVVNGQRLQMEKEVLDTAPCIESLHVDADGLVWIQSGHGDHVDGVFRQFDVFSADGEFLKQVNLVCPGNARDDGLVFLDGGRFLRIKGMRGAVEAARSGLDDEGGPAETADDAAPLELIYCTRD